MALFDEIVNTTRGPSSRRAYLDPEMERRYRPKAPGAVANRGAVVILNTPTHVLIRSERVREKPADDASGERQLGPGTQVRVIEFIGGWAIIARDGQKLGYVPENAVLRLQ